MNQKSRLLPTPQQLDARKASMCTWLLALSAWFVETIERLAPLLGLQAEARRLANAEKRKLRQAVTDLKDLVVFYAYRRAGMPPRRAAKPKSKRRRPLSISHAPPGFRFKQERASLYRKLVRAAFRGFHRGDLKTRIARLRAALENLDLYVERMFKRLERGFVFGRIVPTAPPAAPAAEATPAQTPSKQDTS